LEELKIQRRQKVNNREEGACDIKETKDVRGP
jgi:hypothetical protein